MHWIQIKNLLFYTLGVGFDAIISYLNMRVIRMSLMVKTLYVLLGILLCAYGLSFGASYYWLLDLFTHFLLQYTVGGIVIGALLLLKRKYLFAILALCIAMLSFFQSRNNLHDPWKFEPVAFSKNSSFIPIRLVQYNHNSKKQNFDAVQQWLTDKATEFDMVVFQEATQKTSDIAHTLKTHYPYQIHENREHAFGMVIVSRHPIIEYSIIPLSGPISLNIGIKMVVDIPNANAPLVVYALHAVVPLTYHYFTQRNLETNAIAQLVAKDTHKHKVMMGDWNLTPYSPYFSKLLKESGLHFQAKGLFLNATWPSFNQFAFLKIPIDHVLYSDSLSFLNKEVLPAFGSDHHAMVTTLGMPKD